MDKCPNCLSPNIVYFGKVLVCKNCDFRFYPLKENTWNAFPLEENLNPSNRLDNFKIKFEFFCIPDRYCPYSFKCKKGIEICCYYCQKMKDCPIRCPNAERIEQGVK